MKKLIKYVVSFFFVFLLFPMSVIAGELIEFECVGEIGFFVVDSDGGNQHIAGENVNVIFTKDKLVANANNGTQLIVDFESGKMFIDGEKFGDCKVFNLEALEKANTMDAVVEDKAMEVTKLQESKTYETSCGLTTWFDEMVIRPTRISGSFSLDDFGEDGNIGVDALVEGNGNQARFSNIVEYEKIGNRLELEKDDIKTNVTKEQFQEHFGLFPTVTCSAG